MFSTIVFRGRELAVEETLRKVPHIDADAVWAVGARFARGYVSADNGFSATLAESETWDALRGATTDAIVALRGAIDDAQRQGASVYVTFALFLGEKGRPYEAATFLLSDLQVFVEAGVSLRLSAYPGEGQGSS